MICLPRGAVHLNFPGIHDEEFTIYPARYAKGKVAVTCKSDGTGYKTRAMRLIGDALRGAYSHREHAYIVSPSKAERFYQLYAAGWDASAITGVLFRSTRT